MEEAGFEIRQERMVQEDGKYYVMFSCFPSGNREKAWNDPVLYRYGKYLLEERNPVMKKFLEQQTDKYEKILAGLKEKSPDSEERIGYLKQEVLYMKEALMYYEM